MSTPLGNNIQLQPDQTYDVATGVSVRAQYVWDAVGLAWVKMTQPGGGGGGGGAVTVADGADVAEGATTDAAVVTDVAGTVSGKLRGLVKILADVWDSVNHRLKVDGSGVTQPVSGTFWQATQPVSGTFWQATQPVSGPLTDTQLRASAVPVSLSGNQAVNVAQLAGTATSVNSGVKDAGTLRVVIATDQPQLTNKLLVTPDSVALPANQSVNVNQFGGSAVVTGTGAGGAGIPRVTVSNDSNVLVTPPTLTKGTQGATGFSTQDLKDAGRVNIMWTAEFAHAQTAETLLTLTESRDGAATTTFSSKVVTNGKRLRITSIALEAESLGTGTTPQRVYLRMRFNTAGAVTTGSPLQGVFALGVTTAIVKASEKQSWPFPDGIEFLGDGTKQIGFSLETPDWVVTTATGRSKITITAFEY